jgi:hypothetical protein
MSRYASENCERPDLWEERERVDLTVDDARHDQEADENRRQLLADRALDERREAHDSDRREALEEAGVVPQTDGQDG